MSAPAVPAPQPLEIAVTIPGPPQPYQRTRIAIGKSGGIRPITPAATRSWKGAAQVHMKAAAWRAHGQDAPPFAVDVPLAVWVVAVFACPISDYRKREPRARRWHVGSRGDADNIAKAVLDAGNGALWVDDRQISQLFVSKVIGAQDEAPRVEIIVREIGGFHP